MSSIAFRGLFAPRPYLVVAALLIAILAGSGAMAGSRGAKIILVTLTDVCEYCAMHRRAFLKAAEELGMEVEVRSSEFDTRVQAGEIDWAIAQKPDAIVLWPAEGDSRIIEAIRKIDQADIPLVLTNSKPDDRYEDLWDVYTGPNDLANGELAAKALLQGFQAKGFGTSGRIFIIEGEPGSIPQIDRTDGFERILAGTAPGIEVVAKRSANWQQAEADKAATELFAEIHPGVQGVYAQADNMLAGVIAAAERGGIDLADMVLVGSNCSIEGVTAIMAGTQYASVLQSPIDDGALAPRTVADLLDGKRLPREIYLPHTIVTKQNIAVCDAAIGK